MDRSQSLGRSPFTGLPISGGGNGRASSCDEFPFWSTEERIAGSGVRASLRQVPKAESSPQGTDLNGFYVNCDVGAHDVFLVISPSQSYIDGISPIVDLIKELDAKIKQIAPGVRTPRPPATVEELRTAEQLHGTELTEELAAVAQIHNGCNGYPMFQSQFGLASCIDDLNLAYPFPKSGGPFEERSTAIFAGAGGSTYLLTPLAGEYRGHVFRMSFDGYFSCYAASSISEVVEDWIFYIDQGLFVKAPHSDELVPKGSAYHVEEGPEAIGAAMEAVPSGNPIVLDHIFDESYPAEVALLAERQEPYGIDPRLDPRHLEHGQWQHETEQRRAVQLAAVWS